jgi:hypothetical protein
MMIAVSAIRVRLRDRGFNPEVLSDQLVIAMGHLLYGQPIEGINGTGRLLTLEETTIPRLILDARDLLSYDRAPHRAKQNEWWFVQGMPQRYS